MPPTVILVRPREEGNIGAVARAMANMGLEQLVLVEPAPELGGTARGFGVGGWQVLDGHRRVASLAEAIAPFGRVVGTASGRQRVLRHVPVIAPRQLPEVLLADPAGTETALVFGPEDNGLSGLQLDCCCPVVEIPCAPQHPTLNLAQAVLIVAYELLQGERSVAEDGHLDRNGEVTRSRSVDDRAATRGELEALLSQGSRILEQIGYDQDPIRQRLVRELRRLATRASASSREVRVLRRLLNRAGRVLGVPGKR